MTHAEGNSASCSVFDDASLEAVLQAYTRLWEREDIRDVFESIASAAAQAFEHCLDHDILSHRPGITFWLWDEYHKELFLAAGVDEPIADLKNDYAMPCHEGDGPLPISYYAIVTGKQEWFEDVFDEATWMDGRALYHRDYIRQQDFVSMLATPLPDPRDPGKCIGLLNVFFRESVRPDDLVAEITLMALLANQASLSIDRACRLRHGDVSMALREAGTKATSEVGFLKQAATIIAEAFHSEHCDFYLPSPTMDGGIGLAASLDGERGGPQHYELGEGLTGATALRRGRVFRVVQVGDEKELKRLTRVLELESPLRWSRRCLGTQRVDETGAHQYMAAPLFVRGPDGPVGVVRVMRKTENAADWYRYTMLDARLLKALCEIVVEELTHLNSLEMLTRDLGHRHANDLRMLQQVRVGDGFLADAISLEDHLQVELVRALKNIQVMLDGLQESNRALELPMALLEARAIAGKADLGATLERVARSRFRITANEYEPAYDITPGIMVSTRRVTNAAIAFNELVSNILKYAGPDDDGTCRPAISVRGDGDEVIIQTRNRVGSAPPADQGHERYCGTEIVRNIVTGLLWGQFSDDSIDDGESWESRITFPIEG